MRYQGITFLTAALLTASGAAVPANADPAVGEWSTEHNVMVCNTEEQINSIIAAGQEQGIGAYQRFAELESTIDEHGEPTCALVSSPTTLNVVTIREPQTVWWQTEHAIVATFEIAYKEDRTLWGIQTIGEVETVFPSNYRQARTLEPRWKPLSSLIGL
jgi:hypothetical protein